MSLNFINSASKTIYLYYTYNPNIRCSVLDNVISAVLLPNQTLQVSSDVISIFFGLETKPTSCFILTIKTGVIEFLENSFGIYYKEIPIIEELERNNYSTYVLILLAAIIIGYYSLILPTINSSLGRKSNL